MSGEFGGLSVDRRSSEMLRGSEPSPSTVAARGDREGAGEWSEGLEPFGVTPWELPGQGDRGTGCGEWYPEAVCETCGEPRFASRVCGARSCPDCWGVWAKDAAVRATVRLQAFRYTQPNDWHRQVAHAYVSPPEGEVMTEREYWEGRSKAAEIAKSKGWRGFTVIPHPYRVTEEGKERYRAEDPDYGIWVWLRNDVEGMSRYTKWSPHYHIIGATGADMEPARDGDEWVYQFKRSVESFDGVRDADSHEDLYGLCRYLLSHTGYPEGSTKQTVTWYGDLANNVFVEDAFEDWQNEKPSEGVLSALEREVEAVAGPSAEDDESDGEVVSKGDEASECPCDDCDGVMINVFDVEMYLRQNDPPPDVVEKMKVARDWRLGRIKPPPGMRKPRSREEAEEAYGELL
jgi:hypothetical protein